MNVHLLMLIKIIHQFNARSHRWAKRSINAFNSKLNIISKEGSAGLQELYGIIQGGIYEDLEKKVFILIKMKLIHLELQLEEA